jgi:dihydrofolate reductase
MIANPKLSLIVARAQNGVIGRDGNLPWYLPSDLKLFKATTLGKPVLMGRKTWESLPFPLPGRPNLVLTRDKSYAAKKAEVFTRYEVMVGRGFELAGASNVDEVMVIGGAQLYKTLMPFIDRQYVTQVLSDVEGDAYFDAPDPNVWRLTERRRGLKTEKDDYDFAVEIWDRVSDKT